MGLTKKIIQKYIDKFHNEETWMTIGEGCLKIIAIIIFAKLVIRIGKVTVRNIFKFRTLTLENTSERREETIAKLLDNFVTYAVNSVAIMMILSVLTIDVKALLAGAGIVGIAVGFGAQNLVKDIISGFFIIFEGQFSVGDRVRIGQFEGDVESIGLRTTRIKSWTGEVHILPNGSINEVTNFSVSNSVAVVDVGIAYGEDVEKAEKVITELLQTLPNQSENLVKPPELLGIQTMGPTEVMLRIVAETLPMKQYAVARMIRKDVKLQLDEHGIKTPDPKLVMYSNGIVNSNKQ